MRLRHQLPVASPLPFRAVLAGAAGLVRDAAPAVSALEHAILQRFKAKAVVLTDSGTAALTLALRAAQSERRAPVALPAWACYDLATAAAGADVRVVLYDVDPKTLAPDHESLRAAVAAGAGSFVFAHLYGMAVDIASYEDVLVSAATPPLVINDAAQAAGAMIRGAPVGSAGSLAILSFGRGKGVTGGAGGALIALDERGAALVEKAKPLRRGARGADELLALTAQWVLGRPAVYGALTALPFLHLGETVYRTPRPTRRLPATAAHALGVTWHFIGSDVGTRRRNARRLLACLSSTTRFETVRSLPDSDPGYLRLPVLYDPSMRERVHSAEARRLGIQTGYPEPLAQVQGLAGRCINANGKYPGARTLAFRLCTFPTHRLLEERDLLALEAWIAQGGGAQ